MESTSNDRHHPVTVEVAQSIRRLAPNAPFWISLGQLQERRKRPRIIMPTSFESVDGLVSNPPVGMVDTAQQLIWRVQRLGPRRCLRPRGTFFSEPRVIVLD